MDDDTFLGVDILVFLGNDIGVMAAGGENGRHERLLHLRHLRGIVLQERFVPDGPHAVEVTIATEALVFVIILTTIILLETCCARKSLESHRATLRSVEEGRFVAFACQ